MEFRKTKLAILLILLFSLASLIYAACMQDFYKPHPLLVQQDASEGPNITWDPDTGHHEPNDCGGKIGVHHPIHSGRRRRCLIKLVS